ncbi:hypothetical protein DYB38_002878 [Aphanomyces astaci]|uniref:IQCH-like ATP-grasp domain-containing protein n=1 Tax=Aphanomyces astaci TaxID=112090 RepID=A0A397CWZ9_APHAT|nr:hypothetical protein DYB38_002878 [Aphanomyces astaci]
MNRTDPTAPSPDLVEEDARGGVHNLVTRGFLPPSVDVTPAFTHGTSVIQNSRVKIYDRASQPVKSMPYTNPSGFNMASLKFDMSTTPATSTPSPVAAVVSGGDVSKMVVTPIDISFDAPLSSHPPVEQPKGGATGGDDTNGGDSSTIHNLRRNVEKIRGYNELLDTYSLHQFIIRKGKTLSDTPEFISFQRTTEDLWGSVSTSIQELEAMLTSYSVPLAYVDGQKLMKIAAMDATTRGTTELLSCILNMDEVSSLMRRPGQRYKGSQGPDLAVVLIQSVWRMFLTKKRLKNHHGNEDAAVIQRIYRSYRCFSQLQQRLKLVREADLRIWDAQMQRFRANWDTMKMQRRVVVHVPSFASDDRTRLKMDNFSIRQNLQMARMCAIADPNVDIIYISPFELSPDIQRYQVRLLQLGGITDPQTRIRMLHPENVDRFPEHFSLTTLLLYSPHCLKKIKRFVRGKNAYIVTGNVGPEDKRLAIALQIPLLGMDPDKALLYGTRSGGKRIFMAADVNIPMGAHDIYDEDELIQSLSKLIAADVDQNEWLVKIDADQSDTGIASINVLQMQSVAKVRAEKRDMKHMAAEYFQQPDVRDAVLRSIFNELTESYFAANITPCFPDVREARIIGYASIDYMSFADPKTLVGGGRPRQRLWAMQVVPGLTNTAVSFVMFAFLSCSQFNPITGKCHLQVAAPPPAATSATVAPITQAQKAVETILSARPPNGAVVCGPERAYMVLDYIYHPNMATLHFSTFFNTCRLNGVSFDLQRAIGAAFILADSLTAGVMGLMCIGENDKEAFRIARQAVELIGDQVGVQALPDSLSGERLGNFPYLLAIVKRTFDLTRHIVRQVDDISFRDDDASVATYTVAIPFDFHERLSHMSAKTGKNAVCEVVQGEKTSHTQLYHVQLPSPVLKGADGSIKVTAYFTRILTPLPAAIKQSEDQLVVFHAPHVLPSPYATVTQTTRIKLPSTHIERHSTVDPVSVKGSVLTYGPYTAVPGGAPPSSANELITVHFQHNEPFLTMTSLVKEVDVSMWGRVSTEEVVDVEHTGAALAGGFSRFEYSEHDAVSASFRSFVAVLPKHAVNVYYRDQIGNITTSALSDLSNGHTELVLEARYPLFGGWKTQYYLGYSEPTASVLVHANDRFRLEGHLSTCVEHAAVDDLTLKVILPQGATNVQVTAPWLHVKITHTTRRQSFLDAGRPVVILKKTNVVPAHNDVPFTVSFDYPGQYYVYREPALVVGACFGLFVMYMALTRLWNQARQSQTKQD